MLATFTKESQVEQRSIWCFVNPELCNEEGTVSWSSTRTNWEATHLFQGSQRTQEGKETWSQNHIGQILEQPALSRFTSQYGVGWTYLRAELWGCAWTRGSTQWHKKAKKTCDSAATTSCLSSSSWWRTSDNWRTTWNWDFSSWIEQYIFLLQVREFSFTENSDSSVSDGGAVHRTPGRTHSHARSLSGSHPSVTFHALARLEMKQCEFPKQVTPRATCRALDLSWPARVHPAPILFPFLRHD